MQKCIYQVYDFPVGKMIVGCIGERICICDYFLGEFVSDAVDRLSRVYFVQFEQGNSLALSEAFIQLSQYFLKKRKVFDIPLQLFGTDFEVSVWLQTAQIPYGETVSYSELAERIHKPSAVRAVANALHRNPISIIIPCHRVIGTRRQLVGYAGGLQNKELLLNLEK